MIDQDYRGNVGVVMFNFGEKDFEGKQFHCLSAEMYLGALVNALQHAG